MEKELVAIGLTLQEATVYLATLKLGSASVQEISRRAKTYRTYTYEVLKSLKEKGLVSSVLKDNCQFFESAPPEKLLSMVKENEARLLGILPDLKSEFKSAVPHPQVELFEGKQGIKTLLDDVVSSKTELLAFGSTKKQFDVLAHAFPNFIKLRVSRKIPVRVLTESSEQTLQTHARDSKEFRKMRFYGKDILPSVTYVYEDKVVFLTLEKEYVGVQIKDIAISQSYRFMFELLWKQAEHT
ncbi:MAG: helix-turn-helix domain-containing protein [Candidatus Woesearchaeota archaeon]|nr:helix-turn-helix domain-containing protein [Candidatus Woesearchaeota archaeon]